MIPFLADENLHNGIIRGLYRRRPELDMVRVQDLEIARAEGSMVLDWAARHSRVLLTHDASTIPVFVDERLQEDLPVAGVIIIPSGMALGRAIDELLLIDEASSLDDWTSKVLYLPL